MMLYEAYIIRDFLATDIFYKYEILLYEMRHVIITTMGIRVLLKIISK